MKKIFMLCAVACAFLASCSGTKQPMTVTVTNPLGLDRTGEMVEVPMSEVSAKLQLADTAQFVVVDENGQSVPYQLTYDDKVVFPASVKANGTATYTIQPGTPEPFSVIACGRCYPERMEDMAWENDLAGYRAYGPVLQRKGERGFGYDLFTKYNTSEPVLEEMYANEVHKETRAKINELKKTDMKAAKELERTISYHVDHGYGMDCYAVGPTLGCGTAALMDGERIIYPWCYNTYEILDNGPLRFTVKLEFTPQVVRGDSTVVETRVISLDAGSYLNKTVISYTSLKEAMPITAGIVLREPDGRVTADAANGYITYVDPTTNRSGENGKIFIGCAFPAPVKEAKTVLFSEQEKKDRGGADGHVLAISDYEPAGQFTYYWGSCWNKAAIKTPEAWDKYMAEYAQKLRAPLSVAY